MAYILKQTGDLTTDGNTRKSDVISESLKQKPQLILGSCEDVRNRLSMINKHTEKILRALMLLCFYVYRIWPYV